MTHARPLPYDPSAERAKPGEAQAVAAINVSMRSILNTTWQDYGHPARSVHAKSHGLLEGELQVLDGLPVELAHGVFARPATYPVVLRISTNPGDILDDTVSAPRGLALKIIGVDGERLPGSEGDTTQDFVMANAPAFVAPDAQGFARSLKLLAATTNTGQTWKKGLSAVLRGAVTALKAAGAQGGGLQALGGQPMTHPLGETFYTQAAFRHGEHVAKLSVAPVSPELLALKDAPVDLAGKPNGLRGAVIDFFHTNAATWELRVQLRTNERRMPVEDASVPWPEDESPYVAVARITVPRQPAWSEARAQQVDDGMAFSRWQGIAAHRPLGSINRARQGSYAMSAEFRGGRNGCPIHEPTARPGLSDHASSVFGARMGREGRRPNTPDMRPGAWGPPLNATVRKITAGAVGGLASGALLSLIFLGMEAATSEPSDVVKLKRRAVRRAGWRDRRDRSRPNAGEQAVSHGGHLALSAAAGAVYGAAKPDAVPPVVAGAIFGAGFYALAYGLVGPALRVTPKLSRDTPSSIATHAAFHLLFGVATALAADRVARRLVSARGVGKAATRKTETHANGR